MFTYYYITSYKPKFMKKLVFIFTVVCTGIISNLCMNQSFSKNNSLLFKNVEALARKETVEDCDIFLYNRNEAETSKTGTVKSHFFGGFYTVIDGVEIDLGIQAGGSGSVKIYDCKESTGNCCLKAWLEKPPYYY